MDKSGGRDLQKEEEDNAFCPEKGSRSLVSACMEVVGLPSRMLPNRRRRNWSYTENVPLPSLSVGDERQSECF